jgi:chromosome segregation ATPase
MWIASGSSFELIQFIQILSWIILPALLLTVGITLFLHYRKKGKGNAVIDPDDAENNFILASPERFNHSIKDGEYVYFDHSGLIREYKKRMFYNHARYTALRKDYTKLETKFLSLSNVDAKSLKKHKRKYMKNHNEQLSPVDQQTPAGDFAIERKELSDKLEQSGRSCQRLEEENRFLQEQISLQTATDDEKDKILYRWKEEYGTMKDKVAERSYLEELMEEKKAQILFLQNQLEQRIKNQNLAEQQREQAISEMQQQKEMYQGFNQQTEALKNQVTYLENVLRETKEQNELLNAEVADKKDLLVTLQQQLTDEQSKLQFVEQRLAANKQLLRRLHKEFTSCIEEESEKLLVVGFRHNNKIEATAGNDWEKSAIYPV